jgi:hypothetical protein
MTDVAMPATTRELADFIRRTRFVDLPDTVRREGARAFLNWVGCEVGAGVTGLAGSVGTCAAGPLLAPRNTRRRG